MNIPYKLTNNIVFTHTRVYATTSVYDYSVPPEPHHFTRNRLIQILQRSLFSMFSVQLQFSLRPWHNLTAHDPSKLQGQN